MVLRDVRSAKREVGMDQVKIGRFVKECRKQKNLTQQELADLLGVTFKAVSKWECGKGLPDPSLMLPLCEVLDITVNDLLTGERVSKEEYPKKVEENLVELVAMQKRESKKKIVISSVGIFMGLFTLLFCVIAASYSEELTDLSRGLFVAFGCLMMACGFFIGLVEDYAAGSYECRSCGEKFVPAFRDYFFSVHTVTTRRLKCPHCGKTTYAKRRLIR